MGTGSGPRAQTSYQPGLAVDPYRRLSSVSNMLESEVDTKQIWEPVSCLHQSSFPGHCTHVTAGHGQWGALRTGWAQAGS